MSRFDPKRHTRTRPPCLIQYAIKLKHSIIIPIYRSKPHFARSDDSAAGAGGAPTGRGGRCLRLGPLNLQSSEARRPLGYAVLAGLVLVWVSFAAMEE